MAICQRNGEDPLLRELVREGINIVLPPKQGIESGDLVLGERDGVIRRADWRVVTNVDVDVLSDREPGFRAANFAASSKLHANAGASLLGRALQSFGVSEGSIAGALASGGTTSIDIRLIAPAVKTLRNLDRILQQLRQAKATPAASYRGRRLFIVERIWRAKGLMLELSNGTQQGVELSAKATEQLKANAGLSMESQGNGRYKYSADEPLVFGVTLREITFEDDVIKDKASDQHWRFRSAEDNRTHAFASKQDAFVEVIDDLT